MTDRRAHLNPANGEAGRIPWRLLLLLLGCLLFPLGFGSCARAPIQTGSGTAEDPSNRVDWAMLGGPRGGRVLPSGGTFTVPLPPPRPAGPPRHPKDKLHPRLIALLTTATPPNTKVEVLVTLRDTITIPRFPERLPPGSPLFADREAEIQALIQSIKLRRIADYNALDDSLDSYGLIKDRDSHWLSSAVLMDVQVGQLIPLASFGAVVYIQPRYAGEEPPWTGPNAVTADNPAAARDQIGAEPYYDSYGSGVIGLVDTGVYTGHKLLSSPDRINETWNCLNATPVLQEVEAWETCPDNGGHGTGAAALMAGNDAMSLTHRGLTHATVNVYKAYHDEDPSTAGCSAGLDGNAAALGIQKAVEKGDRVILCETQSTASDWAVIAMQADIAYRTGSVVIAAAGNQGAGVVGSPGNARGAIAVGAYDVQTSVWNSSSGHGIVEHRFKPDVEAPTGCETASARGFSEMMTMGQTSGACPNVAGASLLLRNFMKGSLGTIDAGKIYAALILSGTASADFFKHGAGRMKLFQPDYLVDWGKVDVMPGVGKMISLNVTDPATTSIAAAVWWPEKLEFNGLGYPIDTHNDVDIELYPPNSTTPIPYTPHFDGVFERIATSVSGRVGVWTLKIIPKDLVTSAQTVFWASGWDPVTPAIAAASQNATTGGCGCACTP